MLSDEGNVFGVFKRCWLAALGKRSIQSSFVEFALLLSNLYWMDTSPCCNITLWEVSSTCLFLIFVDVAGEAKCCV